MSVELSTDPADYADQRMAALVQDIDGVGIEESINAIEIAEGQTFEVRGKDGGFMAMGPCVLFIAALPMEAFEED